MSESDKMGLFGSKDENNESTSEEKDDSDKSKETLTENIAPYNIDSDSETYDTEALSIMDINDIIGVQADTPGESTLESEFAALSEIITDAKDEFVSRDEKSAGIGKIVANFAESGTRQEGSTEDCRGEGDSEGKRNDIGEPREAMSTTSISKSLQLIGEAYISEDSQGTDTDDVDEPSVKTPSDSRKTCDAAEKSEKDVAVAARSASERTGNSEYLDRVEEQIISENESICDIETPRSKSAGGPPESPRNRANIESADSTDSVTVEQREGSKDNDDESMVVDSVAASDILEKLPTEIPVKGDKSEGTKVAENAELTTVEEAKEGKQTTDSVVLEEPMEIDGSSELLAIAKIPPTSEIPSDLKTSSEEEANTCDGAKISLENVKNGPELEHDKSSIVNKSESHQSEPPIEESSDGITEEISSETPRALIEESIIEKHETDDKIVKENCETSGSSTERGSEEEKNPEGSNGVENILEADAPLGEPNNAAEPMELDDQPEENDQNAEFVKIVAEKAQDTLPDVQPVSDCASENKTNEENSEETPDLTMESPLISEPREKDLFQPESCETPSKNVDIISIESSVDTGSKEPSGRLGEDEKMEVDGVSKQKSVEGIDELPVHASSKKIEVATAAEETNEEIASGMKSSVDTVDDAAITSTELQENDRIVDDFVKNSNKCMKDDDEIPLECKNVASPIDNPEDTEITGQEDDRLSIEKKIESEIPTALPPLSINEDCEIEKTRSIVEETHISMESKKDPKDAELKKEDETSLSIEKIECSKETEEIEDTNSIMTSVEEEKNEGTPVSMMEEQEVSVEMAEGLREKNEEIEDERIVESSLESEEMKVESVLNEEEKEDDIRLEPAEYSNKKESGIVPCPEKTESLKIEEMETLLPTVEAELASDEKNSVSSNKTERLDNSTKEMLSAREETKSSNSEKEKCSNVAEEKMSSEEENPICPKDIESSLNEDVDISISSSKVVEKKNRVSPEEDESLNNVENESSHEELPENVESPADRSEEIEEAKFSEQVPEEIVGSNEAAKLAGPEEKTSVSSEEDESLNKMENENSHGKLPANVVSSVDRSEGIEEAKLSEEVPEEIVESNEDVKLTEPEEKTSVSSEADESLKKVENENSHEKLSANVVSSVDRSEGIAEAKLSEEVPEEIVGTNEDVKLTDPEETILASIAESMDNPSKTPNKSEADIFSKPKPPSEGSSTNLSDSSMNPASIDIGVEQVDVQMEISVQRDTFEAAENLIDDDPAISSSDRKYAERKEENESNADTSVSMKTEEKEEETNLVQLDDCPVQSSAYKSNENDEENQEKNIEDSDENYVSVTQIFQDDEQSQSTQEMMVSILETDEGNINKILDDQEADDLETSAMDDIAKLPNESEEMLDKALEDPMAAQNIDSLEGLLDLDLMPENDVPNLKSVEPIVDKVIQESCDDIETIGKVVDVSLLMEESDTIENSARSDNYDPEITTKIMNNPPDESIASSVDDLMSKTPVEVDRELEESPDLTEKDLEAFDLASVVTNPLEIVDPSEDAKLDLADDLLENIAADEERKIELTGKLLLEDNIQEQDLLLSPSLQQPTKIDIPDEVFLPVEADRDMELAEDISLDSAVRDQVLNEVAAEMENLPQNSEISELESAVKFLQESEEQDMDLPLVLSPKMVEGVVNDIVEHTNVDLFSTGADICEDPSELVAELESIIPDPIAISEAEIINEAAKLETERKKKLFQETKTSNITGESVFVEEIVEEKFSLAESSSKSSSLIEQSEDRENNEEPQQEIVVSRPEVEKIEHEVLKKSVPIPKVSILEERLKIPPKIEIPGGDVSRMCELPTTPKTSLLIQRDARTINLMKQLESPKSAERSELKIVDTPRKDSEKYDFENVGSPRIILKIAKSAIADCSEPRSPKSPKIRSAANSPNPDDSPGQKLGKIKLKLSKSGHPSIIPNDNVEENCGQWHTEGSSSLSPLGMKIKFSKISDITSAQADKYESEDTREQTPKHKFEEAKRTESPLGMKIKLSKTGEPSIVQQDTKETGSKHREKSDVTQHDSPKRTESSIGMKIKLSKSGDASIVLPEKQESTDEHKDGNSRSKEKLETPQQHIDKGDAPRRTESPLGMKFKLFKTGDASIVQTETQEDNQQEVKRTDSPVSKKIKLSKTRGNTPILTSELNEDTREKLELSEEPKRTDSPLGMKIKLSKRGDASIIHSEESREAIKQRSEIVQEAIQIAEGTSLLLKTKIGKSTAIIQPEVAPDNEAAAGISKRADPTIGMKIKLSKRGDATIVHPERDENSEDTRSKEKLDSSIGMKIKLSKSGDASIVQSQSAKKSDDQSSPLESRESENFGTNETSSTAKTKLQKGAESSIAETEKREKSARRKETESPLEMKIKLSKTGHPTIVVCENYVETPQRSRETIDISSGTSKQSPKENAGMKILKGMQGANRSELTIEPIQLQSRKSEMIDETSPKRKDITISPIDSKKAKLEAKLSHILPEVTIQPIIPRDQKQQIMFEAKAGSISRQQMNVISQEISITQVRSNKPMDLVMTDKLKSILTKNPTAPSNDCEIIEHRPELIIVNENSNSSQDVMIIEEVPVLRSPENKVPKKRGRPRRNPLPIILAKPATSSAAPGEPNVQTDPLALDNIARLTSLITPQTFPPVDNEASGRPKRTCRNQKSYAPPRRGRGGRGGRGKRKMEMSMDLQKRPRIEQDLDMIERSTTALISIHEPPSTPAQDIVEQPLSCNTSELYKALRQPTMDRKLPNAIARNEIEQAVNDTRNNPDVITKSQLESFMDARIMSHLDGVISKTMANKTIPYEEILDKEKKLLLVDISSPERQTPVNLIAEESQKSDLSTIDDKIIDKITDDVKDNKDSSSTMDHENWLTPSSKKQYDGRNEGNISNVQVMDEETRMSAESGSRSQTPAKNMSVQAPETIVNEESQGSVLSTATTESEKVKVKTRRMEINFDPDEGPFTVDKIAEYDWPQDPMKKNETFMIQEQISHYLGVKSFKRKYPDLKRRMVDMEERNYLRENALVSEAMCDMGLTAVLSSEVLDVMCSDFPDQYEEYRKHIREKQMKEHFKKQKELTAAANAEKNRIDLAEMAVQSALSWNVGLNKARRESRKCSLDLQTFTIHVPKKQQKVEEESNSNHYPVALIPGQYTDYYREYTPAELRYYPLNTVLYGPMRPNERKFDSQSEGSQSDSDSDSSSDDSSSSSSEGTQDTEASQSTMDDVDAELSRQKEDIKSIKCKMCLKHLNKFNRVEVLIQCGTCNGYVHPSCIDLTLDMVPHIQAYAWQCTDCKTCAQCHDPADEDKMLFCDMCDRGYHIYCVGLRRVPQGRWHCQECAVCASCGSREAGGTNSDRNSVAQWQHEYKKGDKNTRVYVSTLCVPCSKLCGEQGSDNRPEKLSV